MSAISALGQLRQEDCEFLVSLSYIVRPYLKEKKNLKIWLYWVIVST
jgi:hypothetical protein